jgi:hypothetical protein
MIKIKSMSTTVSDPPTVAFVDEDDDTIVAPIIASNEGLTIVNHTEDGRLVPLQIVDYGDGDIEYFECREGETFDADYRGEYIVRRSGVGSFEWVENEG